MQILYKGLMGAVAVATIAVAAPASAGIGPVKSAGFSTLEQSSEFQRDRRERRQYARGDQRLRNDTRIWRDGDGRYRCRRDNGTTGLLIGGAVGGLAGNEIAGNGDKLLGTVIGAAGGALLGREIDRSNYRCR